MMNDDGPCPAPSSRQRKASYRRQTSCPFLKKPVPRLNLDLQQDQSAPNRQSYNPKHPANYNSIQQRDDDEPPSEDTNAPTTTRTLDRHISLIDLIAIGVGGTVGSGFFVLAGLVAHQYAGPSAVISWLIAGIAACISGCCYAELSARIPLPGSTYAYSYVAMGELPAVLAAACLSLEYIVATAGVARSWGDKCVVWLTEELDDSHWIHDYLDVHSTVSPLACLISTACVVLLLSGVKESKQVTNFFTALKVGVVSFMILAGFYFVRPTNWSPFLPAQFGVSGILRGSSATFFGYLGYDQVCCIAGEVQNPKQNLPLAVIGVLIGVTFLYMLGTLALVGMQPYEDISPVSGFPSGFYRNNAKFVGELTALGEILTLPIVVLITIMMQPRLQYAMAVDGLLPPFFGEVDSYGNLWNGTFVSGGLMILVATLVPFAKLNDVISCAVLSALSMTDTSLILLWHEAPHPESGLAESLVLSFHGSAFLTSVMVTSFLGSWIGKAMAFIGVGGMVLTSCELCRSCPRSNIFGGARQHYHGDELLIDDGYFRTPLVPFWPCIGIFINWYLVAQIEWVGVVGLLCYLGLAVLYYFMYAAHHSVGNTAGWAQHSTFNGIEEEILTSEADEQTKLTRSLSMPMVSNNSDD